MTIRHADDGDRLVLLEMGARFIHATGYREVLRVDPERIDQVVTAMLAQGGVWVLEGPEGPVGMLGVLLAPLPLTGEPCAIEVMWWVEPASRGHRSLQLFEWAEDWAQAQGAESMQMLQPVANARLADLYRRRGYVPVETTWYRRFEQGGHHAA